MEFSEAQLALHFATFCAAALQTIIGIGFGVVAGPALMLAMQDVSAVQVSVLLSFLVAAALCRSSFRQADRIVFRDFLAGALPGVLLGALACFLFAFGLLKTLAGATVLAMLVLTFLEPRRARKRDSRSGRLLAGSACGFLTTLLAMPGPPLAAYLLFARIDIAKVRATTLAMFMFAYPAAFAAQALAVGIGEATFPTAATLAPAALLGVLCGTLLVKRVSERLFRQVVRVVLLIAGSALLF